MSRTVAFFRNLHRMSYGGGFTVWCYTLRQENDDPSVEWIIDNCNGFFRNFVGKDDFRSGDKLIISDPNKGRGAIRFIRKIENGSDTILLLDNPL